MATTYSDLGYSQIIGALLTAVLVVPVGTAFYYLFLHPLRRYPGPKLWAISNIPWNWSNLRLKLSYEVHDLHEKYGPVVRIGPNQLSFNSAAAWKEIFSGTGTSEYLKDLHRGFGVPQDANVTPEEWPMTVSDTPKHRRIRRALLPAFSERALREQEPLIHSYIDTLIMRLRERAGKGPEDIVTWINRFTFDALGHFCFGQSFDALKDATTPELVDILGGGIPFIPVSQFAQQYGLTRVLGLFVPAKMLNLLQEYNVYATKEVLRVMDQMKQGTASSGLFFSYVMAEQDANSKISEQEAVTEGRMLMTAGAETTTSVVAGSIFYICKDPAVYKKLADEIRSTFTSEDKIIHADVAGLEYTNAVLKETFRIYPPLPGTIPRMVPPEGAQIFGQYVPGNTVVGVPPYSTTHSAANFHRPSEYIPERWFARTSNNPEYKEFADDKLEASQPFSYGPRTCLGKPLAWVEIRLLLCRLIWSFDFELAPESQNWMDTDVHLPTVAWVKPPLLVNMIPVKR